jgi:aspartyl/asparaginyl-tRNA synthetase
MYRVILFFVGFNCLVLMCCAQDTITMNDVKVIKARSEITIERYFNNLLNTISYAGAENTDIKELINQSFEDNDKQLFLNNQIAIADDISDPDYSNSSNSPDVPIVRYLSAFNTFYGKSDANSVYFSDVSSSPVKRGKKNIYMPVKTIYPVQAYKTGSRDFYKKRHKQQMAFVYFKDWFLQSGRYHK